MTRIWENMVYLIFDKSANPTPTLARLDISVQVEKKNFLKGFYKFFKSSGRKRYFGLFSAMDISSKGGSGCRSWELKWSTRCPGSASSPRWKTLRSAGNITTVSVETRTLGAKTFVLDDSRFCGGRITIWKKDESLKCQGLHCLPEWRCMHWEVCSINFLFFAPACGITGTWAGPGVGHFHLQLTIPCN